MYLLLKKEIDFWDSNKNSIPEINDILLMLEISMNCLNSS